MSLDDLRTQQQTALRAAAQYESAKQSTENIFNTMLDSLGPLVNKRTGLEVLSRGRFQSRFSSGTKSFSIEGRDCLTLEFPGLQGKGSVSIHTLDCSFAREPDDSWNIHVWEEAVDDKTLEFSIKSATPWVPLRVDWKYNLWWRGPQDNDKLVTAVADALLRKDYASEFVLRDSKKNSGCLLTLIFMLTLVCGVAGVLAHFGLHG